MLPIYSRQLFVAVEQPVLCLSISLTLLCSRNACKSRTLHLNQASVPTVPLTHTSCLTNWKEKGNLSQSLTRQGKASALLQHADCLSAQPTTRLPQYLRCARERGIGSIPFSLNSCMLPECCQVSLQQQQGVGVACQCWVQPSQFRYQAACRRLHTYQLSKSCSQQSSANSVWVLQILVYATAHGLSHNVCTEDFSRVDCH